MNGKKLTIKKLGAETAPPSRITKDALRGRTVESHLEAIEEKTDNVDNIAIKTDVLLEFTASMWARFSRYIDRNNIDSEDATNLVVMLENDAFQTKRDIYACKTLEELLLIEGRLRYMRNILDRLIAMETANV